jgi:hypothetical protein
LPFPRTHWVIGKKEQDILHYSKKHECVGREGSSVSTYSWIDSIMSGMKYRPQGLTAKIARAVIRNSSTVLIRTGVLFNLTDPQPHLPSFQSDVPHLINLEARDEGGFRKTKFQFMVCLAQHRREPSLPPQLRMSWELRPCIKISNVRGIIGNQKHPI